MEMIIEGTDVYTSVNVNDCQIESSVYSEPCGTHYGCQPNNNSYCNCNCNCDQN